MKGNYKLIIRTVKRFLFFFPLVLLIFYIFYEVDTENGLGFPWPLIALHSIVLGAVTSSYYKHETMEEDVGDFEFLKKYIEKSRFKILEQREDSFLLKPKFDYPYSFFNRDRVQVQYSDQMAKIEGPKYYVESLIKDIRGDANIVTRLLSSISIFILIFTMGVLPLLPTSGTDWDFKQWYHNLKPIITVVDIIEIEDNMAVGNTIGNINNYGFSTENEDYIFYVDDHLNILRTDKDFQDKVELSVSEDGWSMDYLNIIEDWIFYRQGDELNRMNIDGSNVQTIYNMSHLLDVHIKGNWIYFLNPDHDFSIYKMDINGENIEQFLRILADDIAVFEDRLYFSHSDGAEGGYVESIGLDGYNRQVEFEAMAYNLSIYDEYYYYIGYGNKLYRSERNNDNDPEILVDEFISSYIITDSGIFYSPREEDRYEGKGLYRIEVDGSEETLILNDEILELAHVDDYILFTSYDQQYEFNLKRLNITTGNVEIVEKSKSSF